MKPVLNVLPRVIVVISITSACSSIPEFPESADDASVPNCGSPVTVDRVMVVDLSAEEGMDGPVIADAEPYRLISDTAVAVKSTGSRVRTIRSATRLAARNGCDLLIIGPFEESRSPIHSAPASNRGGSSTLKRFLMVHMGVRQGEPDL